MLLHVPPRGPRGPSPQANNGWTTSLEPLSEKHPSPPKGITWGRVEDARLLWQLCSWRSMSQGNGRGKTNRKMKDTLTQPRNPPHPPRHGGAWDPGAVPTSSPAATIKTMQRPLLEFFLPELNFMGQMMTAKHGERWQHSPANCGKQWVQKHFGKSDVVTCQSVLH